MLRIGKQYDHIDIPYERNGKVVTIRIRRSGQTNDELMDKSFRVRKPYKKQIESETISARKLMEITSKALAGTVLIGWNEEQMTAALGQSFPYSEANAERLLIDDPDFRQYVAEQAAQMELFDMADEDQLAGE